MTSPKNYVLILLALTTIVGAGIAWNQYRELVELRAAAMNTDERAEWQRRAWDLEKQNRELQDELAALRAAQGDDTAALLSSAATERPAADEGRGRAFRGGRGGGGPQQQLNAMRELVTKPEVQALMRVQQQAAIDARYAALFRNLNLPPDQLDKLKTLLAERQTTLQDVMLAARDQGIEPRSDPAGFRKLITDAQNEINNGIKATIGDAGFAQLQTYEQTMPQRSLVNELQQRLSYTNSPLTPGQADQLVQILASTTPQPQRGPNNQGGRDVRIAAGFGPGMGGGDMGGLLGAAMGGPGGGFFTATTDAGRGGAVPVTNAAIAQAQAILAPPQVTALQQIQKQQQSQQQLQQLVRQTLGNQQGPGGDRGGAGQATQPAAGGGGGGNQKRRTGGG